MLFAFIQLVFARRTEEVYVKEAQERSVHKLFRYVFRYVFYYFWETRFYLAGVRTKK